MLSKLVAVLSLVLMAANGSHALPRKVEVDGDGVHWHPPLLETVQEAFHDLGRSTEDSGRVLHPHYDVSYAASKCGFGSPENFRTWFENLYTDSPVLFPHDEDELVQILTKVKANGCKLRVRGAGHSDDGVVMQKWDENVVVVNLRDFTPRPAWNGIITETEQGDTATVRLSAGASLLDMIALVRPQGWLPFTSYPLPSFSVAGAYLNPSTHGQTYGQGRLLTQVAGLRVLHADGTFHEYTDENNAQEIKDWRGSMGLLGIVTGVEIRLRKDTGLAMNRDLLKLKDDNDKNGFDEEKVRSFVQKKLDTNNGTDFFYYVQDDVMATFELDFEGDPSFDPVSTKPHYAKKTEKYPDLSWTGGSQEDFAHLLELTGAFVGSTKGVASMLGMVGRAGAESQFDTNADELRDGFWVEPDHVNRVEILFYSVKCKEDANAGSPICLDEIMRLFRTTRRYLLDVQELEDSDWYPTFPVEWRLFTVSENELTLEHLTPGTYVGFENLALRSDDNLVFTKYHKELEEMWRRDFPVGGIHHGKQYGYAELDGAHDLKDYWYPPFQNNSILDSIYSDAVKSEFRSRMEHFDPDGVFAAGSVLRLLEITQQKYTPSREDRDIQSELDFARPSDALILVELVVLGLVCLLGILLFVRFRRARRSLLSSSTDMSLQSTPQTDVGGGTKDGGKGRVLKSYETPASDDGENESLSTESSKQGGSKYTFPLLRCMDLELKWSCPPHEGTVMKAEHFWLGGCKVTAIQGPSGHGKSTFLKLLTGYPLSHMRLSVSKVLSRPPIVLCPQSPDMWPSEMLVRDIVLFAKDLYETSDAHMDAVLSAFDMSNLLNQQFGTLSGGQQRLVTVLTTVMTPEPSLVLLDEPFASLDQETATKLIGVLKKIRIHAFVVSVHMVNERVSSEFDRLIPLVSGEEGAGEPEPFEEDDSIDFSSKQYQENKGSLLNGFHAMCTLWFAQYYGFPLVELVLAFVSLVGGLIFGSVVRGATTKPEEDDDYIPYVYVAPLPLYFAGVLMGISVNTSFSIPLTFGVRERKILMSFVAQRSLSPASFVLMSLVRCTVNGTIQAVFWCIAFLPISQLWGSNWDALVVNTAIFGLSWALLTFWVASVVPTAFSPHAMVIMSSYTTLMSGTIVPWRAITQGLQILHYFTPSFYFIVSSSAMILYDVTSGCDHGWSVFTPDDASDINSDNFFDTISNGICASGAVAFEAFGFPRIPSWVAQLVGLGIAALASFGTWFELKKMKGHIVCEKGSLDSGDPDTSSQSSSSPRSPGESQSSESPRSPDESQSSESPRSPEASVAGDSGQGWNIVTTCSEVSA